MLSFKKFLINYLKEAEFFTSFRKAKNPKLFEGRYTLFFVPNETFRFIHSNEKVHGKMSHAIFHFWEFDTSGFMIKSSESALSLIENYLQNNPEADLILSNTTIKDGDFHATSNSPIHTGQKAIDELKKLSPIEIRNCFINTFAFINDKIETGKTLLPIETEIKSKIIDPIVENYDRIADSMMSKSIDIDSIKTIKELDDAVKSNKKIKFVADKPLSGLVKAVFYINFYNTAMISQNASSDKVATLFLIYKDFPHNQDHLHSIPKIKEYFKKEFKNYNSILRQWVHS